MFFLLLLCRIYSIHPTTHTHARTMCLFICDPSKPCNFHQPQTFILSPNQSQHPNIFHRFQPDRSKKGVYHLGANFPAGECISILPCSYCLQLDPSMLSYWWRVPVIPEIEGAACRPTRLVKHKPLFEWEIVGRGECEGYVRKEVDGVGRKEFDPFAGLPYAKWPDVATPRSRSVKEGKAVAWADPDVDVSMDLVFRC